MKRPSRARAYLRVSKEKDGDFYRVVLPKHLPAQPQEEDTDAAEAFAVWVDQLALKIGYEVRRFGITKHQRQLLDQILDEFTSHIFEKSMAVRDAGRKQGAAYANAIRAKRADLAEVLLDLGTSR